MLGMPFDNHAYISCTVHMHSTKLRLSYSVTQNSVNLHFVHRHIRARNYGLYNALAVLALPGTRRVERRDRILELEPVNKLR